MMVKRVNQVSAASPQLDQVQSVHVVLLEPRVTKAPQASAFRVKPVLKVHLVSLVSRENKELEEILEEMVKQVNLGPEEILV